MKSGDGRYPPGRRWTPAHGRLRPVDNRRQPAAGRWLGGAAAVDDAGDGVRRAGYPGFHTGYYDPIRPS